MATIQIRDIPEEDYEVLRDAAKAQGKSLQAFMKEQASIAARRARKQKSLEIVRDLLATNEGSGVTRESILADLDAVRGEWPDDKD